MSMKRNPLSDKEVEARRSNAQHSTGPRTEAGKARVALNATKTGLYCDRLTLEAMVLLGEDPNEFLKIFNRLVESLAPQNGAQLMLVEDLAMNRWERRRNQRAQAGLIGTAQEELDLRQTRALQGVNEGETAADDLPREEVLRHGLRSLPPSPGKFQKMLDLLLFLVSLVKTENFALDAEGALDMIYGRENPTLRAASLRRMFADLRPGGKAEKASPATREEEKKRLLEALEKEYEQVKEPWVLYLEEFGKITSAQKDACYAPRGRVWRLLLRQEQTLEREMERKLRLLWDMQRQDRERMQRMYAERDWEYLPEDAAEERTAEALMGRMKQAYDKFVAEVKAARERNRGQETGNREVQRGQAQGAEGEEQEPANPETGNPDFGSSARPEAPIPDSASWADPEPPTPDLGSSTLPTEPSPSVKMTEQSEYVAENTGPASENKAETNREGG